MKEIQELNQAFKDLLIALEKLERSSKMIVARLYGEKIGEGLIKGNEVLPDDNEDLGKEELDEIFYPPQGDMNNLSA